jgi:hypothetical protein
MLRAFGAPGYEKPQSGCALCGVFLRHIFAHRKPAVCFMGGQNRHIQPERYAKCPKIFSNIEDSLDKKGKLL